MPYSLRRAFTSASFFPESEAMTLSGNIRRFASYSISFVSSLLFTCIGRVLFCGLICLFFCILGFFFRIVCAAACQQGYGTAGISPDAQRAAGGAVAGAVIAKALDEDLATGAAIGAVGGALCDDAGVCQRRY